MIIGKLQRHQLSASRYSIHHQLFASTYSIGHHWRIAKAFALKERRAFDFLWRLTRLVSQRGSNAITPLLEFSRRKTRPIAISRVLLGKTYQYTDRHIYSMIDTMLYWYLCILRYTPMYLYAILVHLHTCTLAYLYTCILANWHTCTLIYLHTHILNHSHTCTLTYLHTG